jgi:hypothetical protein
VFSNSHQPFFYGIYIGHCIGPLVWSLKDLFSLSKGQKRGKKKRIKKDFHELYSKATRCLKEGSQREIIFWLMIYLWANKSFEGQLWICTEPREIK